MLKHSLKQIVGNGNMAKLSHVCEGIAYYQIDVEDSAYQVSLNSMDDEWKATFIYPEFNFLVF